MRGRPETLVLEKLEVKKTAKRAPGPGPLRVKEWNPIGNRLLRGAHVVLHTDSARAYEQHIDDVLHTRVVHQKKKVGSKWIKPYFTKHVTLKLATGQRMRRIAGTQTIDGLWTTIRKESRCYQGCFDTLDDLVRLVQWKIWSRGMDKVKALAVTCRSK